MYYLYWLYCYNLSTFRHLVNSSTISMFATMHVVKNLMLLIKPHRYLPLLCIPLLLFGCGDKLPKPTQTGSNTFGCKINGKKWVPNGGGLFSGLEPVSGSFLKMTGTDGKKYIGINIRAYSDDGQRVQVLLNSRLPTAYVLNQDTPTRPAALTTADYGYYKSASGETFVTSSKYTGSVIISRVDTVNNIISGQFYFTAVNSKGGTVKITEGRFDIKSPQ